MGYPRMSASWQHDDVGKWRESAEAVTLVSRAMVSGNLIISADF